MARVARVAPVRSRETRVAAGRVGSSRGGQVPRRPSYKNTCFNGKTPRVRKSQTANRVHGTNRNCEFGNSTERAERNQRKVKTQKVLKESRHSSVTSRKTNVFNVENSVSHSHTLGRQLSGKVAVASATTVRGHRSAESGTYVTLTAKPLPPYRSVSSI